MKTAAAVLAVLVLAAPASAATVQPERAAAGETVVVTAPPGDVELVPLDGARPARPLGSIGESGALTVVVPNVPPGRYRVAVAGGEAPILEVLPLSQETSLLLVGFGIVLVLALAVGALVLHRRWRDATG